MENELKIDPERIEKATKITKNIEKQKNNVSIDMEESRMLKHSLFVKDSKSKKDPMD